MNPEIHSTEERGDDYAVCLNVGGKFITVLIPKDGTYHAGVFSDTPEVKYEYGLNMVCGGHYC